MVAESTPKPARRPLDQVIAGHPHGLSPNFRGRKACQATEGWWPYPSAVESRDCFADEPMASMDRGLEERLMGLLLGGSQRHHRDIGHS